MTDTNQFNRIEEAIEDFRVGKPLIVADDEDRENEKVEKHAALYLQFPVRLSCPRSYVPHRLRWRRHAKANV